MRRDLLISVDAGTSVLKAVAFTLAGDQVAVAARPNAYDNLGGGRIEQDMARTWRDCAETIAELAERVPDLDRRAVALSITAQGDGCWLVDAAGEPMGGGLLWLDSRAAGLVDDYRRSDTYPRHYDLTGSGVNACIRPLDPGRPHRARSRRLRGASRFAARDCYAASGAAPEEVRIGGGAARSEALRSIVAAALGSQVRVSSREELGSAGAAMMVAACVGAYPDVAACAEDWVIPSLGATTAPDPGPASRYAERFALYRATREAVMPTWDRLSELRREDCP